MKVVTHYCDVCGKEIACGPVEDVKGINIRVDLERGAFDSFVFPHACDECRKSVAAALSKWKESHSKAK